MPEYETLPFDVHDFYTMIADKTELYLLVVGSFPPNEIFVSHNALHEVVARGPDRVDAYFLDRPSKIIFEDGRSVGESISLTEMFRTYLFSLERVDLSGVTPLLIGNINRYYLHSNTLSDPLEKVVVYLSSSPTSKTRTPIGPF